MKLKPLEAGDSVRVKYTVQVHGKDSVVYLDGKLDRLNRGDCDWWLVEYQLDPEFNAPKYTDWWRTSDITSKHYLATTDEEYFEKAEKIASNDYDGMVFYDDQYFESINNFLEWANDNDYDPKFVWACDSSPVKLTPDLVDMIKERLDEEGYEGMSERSQFHPFYDDLRIVEDKIIAMAAKETVWYVNYKKAVVL